MRQTIDRTRLAVGEMRRRDWALLSELLPELEACSEFERALTFFVWGNGWLTLSGFPADDGRKYLRRVWRGLAGGPYRAGPFRVSRNGRWKIAFTLDPQYAAERAGRRQRCHRLGGLDAAFESDFRRRSKAVAR